MQIYTFKNIRFAAPPVGDLRWAKPAPPATETEIQDGSYGPICIQAPVKGPKLTGPGASSPIGMAANQYLAGIPIPSFTSASEGMSANQFSVGIPVPSFTNANEGMLNFEISSGKKSRVDESADCLFLDVYVPAAAVKNPSLKLPVVSWIFGGAFIFGGKDSYGDLVPFYDGTGLIQQSDGNVIFVASNYRVDSPFLLQLRLCHL